MFNFKVGPNYPHEPPKVKCETQVYHPNIDQQGNVCLNILREDWKPVLTINSIVYGLQYLFLEPNAEDPLNKEAAEVLTSNRRLFEQNVQKAIRGGYVGNVYFDKCLKWCCWMVTYNNSQLLINKYKDKFISTFNIRNNNCNAHVEDSDKWLKISRLYYIFNLTTYLLHIHIVCIS